MESEGTLNPLLPPFKAEILSLILHHLQCAWFAEVSCVNVCAVGLKIPQICCYQFSPA